MPVLESAWYRLESAWYRWLGLYRDSWQRRFSCNVPVVESTSDSECDSRHSPRSSIQDLRSTPSQDLRVLKHTWLHWLLLRFVEKRRCYSTSCSSTSCQCSDDSFFEGKYDD